jgi:hypothetical protein
LGDAEKVIQHSPEGDKNDEKQTFRFASRTGRVSSIASGSAKRTAQEPPAASDEATLANNEQTLVVNRGKGPYRILYVTGRPNWDLKFLKRAIEEDEQVQLVVLLRVARREPKYNFLGHRGEATNPLFRGFDPADKEKVEEYDQPVLIRLNTRDQAELREGFPKTKEDLFEYCAVIFDDIEASFFSQDQMDLVRRFVAERGGGFLMLGGKDSFQRGGFDRTPIGSILPVYLDSMPAADAPASTRWELTREGQAWARLATMKDEQQRLAEMPEFHVLNRVHGGRGPAVTTAGMRSAPRPSSGRNGRTAPWPSDVWARHASRDARICKFWRRACADDRRCAGPDLGPAKKTGQTNARHAGPSAKSLGFDNAPWSGRCDRTRREVDGGQASTGAVCSRPPAPRQRRLLEGPRRRCGRRSWATPRPAGRLIWRHANSSPSGPTGPCSRGSPARPGAG